MEDKKWKRKKEKGAIEMSKEADDAAGTTLVM